MSNQSSITIPADLGNLATLRYVLTRLVEQVDISSGLRDQSSLATQELQLRLEVVEKAKVEKQPAISNLNQLDVLIGSTYSQSQVQQLAKNILECSVKVDELLLALKKAKIL